VSWWRLDADLLAAVREGGPPAVRVWEPPVVAVVLGRSNKPEQEAYLDLCEQDGVPVLQRRGGGGAVLLSPGCLVVTLGCRVEEPLAVGRHLEHAVERIRRALQRAAGVVAEIRGTGDLCLGDRKVLGSSAFIGRGAFFYQASLLVSADLALIERYLRHPSREPAYRRGRSHRAFLTTLSEAGYALSPQALGPDLEHELVAEFGSRGTGPFGTSPARGV